MILPLELQDFWWINHQSSLSISFHHGSPYSYITWCMYNRPNGWRSSETSSHLIDMIIIMVVYNELLEDVEETGR
jgi:hypothetical protein